MRVVLPTLLLGALASATGCERPAERHPVEMVPIGTEVGHGPAERPRDVGEVGVNSATPVEGAPGTATSGCPLEGSDLSEVFRAACEVEPSALATTTTLWKDLEVSAQPAAPQVKAGAAVDVEITLKNRGAEPLSLALAGAAEPTFELAASDARGRRVDVPAGKVPKAKGGPPRKVYVLILAAGQVARGRAVWEASKMRWAPERVKDAGDRPFPRVAAGPLVPGRHGVVVHPPFAAPPTGKERPPSARFDVDVVR